ncbi:MAG: UbiH/UbiF family hydroxylase [Rhizobiaceae bacterium]|nr:UbiH/UbiF family hydroxylase [Rhizobiaceae bacterium]
MKQFEVLVVGGGLAGMSAALACDKAGFKTAIIAKKPTKADGRTTALFMPSIDFLDDLGVWEKIKDQTSALKTMRILDSTNRLIRSRPASFPSSEIGLEAFGYNFPNHPLLEALCAQMDETEIEIFDNFASDYGEDADQAIVTLDNGESVSANHVLASDGRNSLIRQKVDISANTWGYKQKAIVLTFAHKFSHQNISTEFHTEKGPFTQVPLPGRRSSLVWAIKDNEEEHFLNLPKTELNMLVEQGLHSTLGPVEIDSDLQCFPLSSLIATRFGKGHVMLIGEAAHAFPPIGAQGLNLGLRDVMTAIECLVAHRNAPVQAAEAYDRKRRADIHTRTFGIDMFNRTLLTSFLPVQLIRSGAISAISSIAPLRQFVMRQGALPGVPKEKQSA